MELGFNLKYLSLYSGIMDYQELLKRLYPEKFSEKQDKKSFSKIGVHRLQQALGWYTHDSISYYLNKLSQSAEEGIRLLGEVQSYLPSKNRTKLWKMIKSYIKNRERIEKYESVKEKIEEFIRNGVKRIDLIGPLQSFLDARDNMYALEKQVFTSPDIFPWLPEKYQKVLEKR